MGLNILASLSKGEKESNSEEEEWRLATERHLFLISLFLSPLLAVWKGGSESGMRRATSGGA